MQRAFNLRPGELFRAVVMQAYIFLIICTLLVIKPTVNSLFLSEHGARNLPFAFLLVAVFAGFVTSLISRIFSKKSLITVVRGTLLVSVLSLGLFGFFLGNFSAGWLLYAVYVWVAVFAVLSASQFWLLANDVFNTREAKRIFGFIGAGAIAGGIAGGYLATFLVPYIGSANLLYLGGGLLLLGFPLLSIVKNQFLQNSTRPKLVKKDTGSAAAWRLVAGNKHLRYLALIVGISVLVAKLVDFQFSAIAAERISDEDRLTGFFGFWFSTFNVVSLVIQLFLTARLIKKLRLGASLMLLPGGILIGAVLLLFIPELWVAVLLKMSDGCLKQSVNKSAFELLSLPIPNKIKGKTKTFIDVLVDSVATGLSGILLLLVIRQLELPPEAVSILTIALIAVWLFLIRGVEKTYVVSFRKKIKPAEMQEPAIVSGEPGTLGALSSKSAADKTLAVLRRIGKYKRIDLRDGIKKLLDHRSEFVRAEALRHLGDYEEDNPQLNGRIRRMLFDKSSTVKIEAFLYLLQHAPELRHDLLEEYLQHGDFHVRGAALVGYAKLCGRGEIDPSEYPLTDLTEDLIAERAFLQDKNMRDFVDIVLSHAIGHGRITEYYDYLETLFEVAPLPVKRQAIFAAGLTRDIRFVPRLLQYLREPELRKRAAVALSSYREQVLPRLNELSKDLQPELLPGITGVYARIPSKLSLERLQELAKSVHHRDRRHVLRALSNLKELDPDLPFDRKNYDKWLLQERAHYLLILNSLNSIQQARRANRNQRILGRTRQVSALRRKLIERMEEELTGSITRIFRLLDLAYPRSDLRSLHKSFKHKRLEVRSNVIEVLDNILLADHKRHLIPMLEARALIKDISQQTSFLGLLRHGEQQALVALRDADLGRISKNAEKLRLLLGGSSAKIIELGDRA